jgi:hypothetical protein
VARACLRSCRHDRRAADSLFLRRCAEQRRSPRVLLGLLGLSLTVIARVFGHAAALKAERDEIF